MSTPYPKTCALLKRNGIDPSDIAIEGFSDAGYFTFELDADRKKISQRGVIKKEFHQWPNIELARRVMETFITEGVSL